MRCFLKKFGQPSSASSRANETANLPSSPGEKVGTMCVLERFKEGEWGDKLESWLETGCLLVINLIDLVSTE